jgi:hypothetical protein
MQHHFTVEIAKEYGINCAILLDNFIYWQKENEANKRNFHDGRYWTYNTVKAFTEMFPYLSTQNIRTAIGKLMDAGLIISGEYSGDPYDHTKWYSVTEKGMQFYQIDLLAATNLELLPATNRIVSSNKSHDIQIENNTDNKPYNKHFAPPTLEEIQKYITEKGLHVDAKQFYDYFEAGNWVDSKGNRVKSWKQKLLTWDNMRKKDPETKEPTVLGVIHY